MALDRWRPFGGLVESWEPFRASDVQREMDRLFDDFFGRRVASALSTGERMWTPTVDIRATKNDLVVTVKGVRRFDSDVKDESQLRLERVYGKFERSIQLPLAVQSEKVTARDRDGVMEVTLPKAEDVKPREIKIDVL